MIVLVDARSMIMLWDLVGQFYLSLPSCPRLPLSHNTIKNFLTEIADLYYTFIDFLYVIDLSHDFCVRKTLLIIIVIC